MDFAELARALDPRLDGLISRGRAAHSRRVAELAASLCTREGIDPGKGRAGGLAHDMCKDMPRKAQRELAASYPEAVPGAVLTPALMSDKVVHGPAAAVLLARDYSVSDRGLLEAVALHTLGSPDMGALPIILYCSDKLEPGRERLDEAERKRCLALPLAEMLLAVVEGVIGWMGEQGRDVAPETLILYSNLTREADPQ